MQQCQTCWSWVHYKLMRLDIPRAAEQILIWYTAQKTEFFRGDASSETVMQQS